MESWLTQSGAPGLDALELADFLDTGRGIRSLRRLKEGEKIFTIPHRVLWTVEHAYADPTLGPALNSARPPLCIDDTLAIYILFVRSRTSGYDGRQSHVAALPTSYASSICFTEAELEVCKGSSLYATTNQLAHQIKADYQKLDARLFKRHGNLFPREKFTIDDYRWALCTVWSRAMDFKLQDGKSIRLLGPFADMLNHSPQVGQCHTYDPLSGNLSVLAGKTYECGDQVFINYGPVPNNRLLRLYGFVMPGNPNDCYDLILATQAEAPLFERKRELWTLAGLDSTCTITLTLKEPLPSSILRYLRIQRVTEPDLGSMLRRQGNDISERISDANEVEVLIFLVESISSLLDEFEPQLEKLEELLAEGVFTQAGNAWAAAHVSIGEQRILRLTRKTAKGLLAMAASKSKHKEGSLLKPAQCAKCEKTSAQLMRCGRCNATMYCGRDCQVAHFKEHKMVCKAMALVNGPEDDS